MARRGGYVIIDLLDLDIISSKTIDDIYDTLTNNHRKVILLSGITIDGVEYNDTFVNFTLDEDDKILISVYGYTITIDVDNSVVATLIEDENEE